MAAQTKKKLCLEDLTKDELREIAKLEESYPYYRSLCLEEKEEKLLRYIAEVRAEKERQNVYDSYLEAALKKFKPKDLELYDLKKWKFDYRFLSILEYLKKDHTELKGEILKPLEEVLDGVFRFPMLEEKFAIRLLDEVAYFQEWCKKTCKHIVRPNSMNNYGAILDHFGFKTALSDLVSSVIQPLANRLFRPEFAKKYGLDSHHGFLVEYEPGKDTNLDFHRDDSEITLNLCLGRQFQGGDLYFGGVRCSNCREVPPYSYEEKYVQHEPGVALLHLGAHRHAATSIKKGIRRNLILWCNSSGFRKNKSTKKDCPVWCGARS